MLPILLVTLRLNYLKVGISGHITDLDEVSKSLFTRRTGESAIYCMNSNMIFEQVQLFKGFWAQETGVRAVFRVHQQMVLQSRVTHEALRTNVAGEGIGISAMDPQVLLQFVFFTESFATVSAFERTKTLSDEEVSQRCIL